MIALFGSPEEIIFSAQTHAKEFAPLYANFLKQWKRAIKILQTQEIKEKVHQMIS